MSKQEKRYFKLFTTFYTNRRSNNYTLLFDVIDKLAVYDESRLLKLIAKTSFAGRLADTKQKLSKLILNSLAAYQAGKTINSDLREMLAHAEILHQKGLYRHCRKLLVKLKKKAKFHQKHIFLLEVLFWERRLLVKEAPDDLELELLKLNEQKKSAMAMIKSTDHFLELMDNVQSTGRRYARLHRSEDRQALEQAFKESRAESGEDATTFVARISHWEALGFYSQLTGKTADALHYYRKALEVWEDHAEQIQDDPDTYKMFLSNYLTCCIALRQFEDFQRYLQRIKALPSISLRSKITMFEQVSYLELMFCLNNGKLEEGMQAVREFEAGIESYRAKISPNRLVTMRHNCSILYFLAGSYVEALEHINAIIDLKLGESRQDIQMFTRIFSVILHYELGNFDILENLLRSAYRYLNKRNAYLDYERLILNAIKRLVASPDSRTARTIFHRMRKELQLVSEGETHKLPVGLPELLIWVESKIERVAIRAVYISRLQEPVDPRENG